MDSRRPRGREEKEEGWPEGGGVATLRGNNLLRYREIWQKFSNEVSLRAKNQQHKQMNEQVNE